MRVADALLSALVGWILTRVLDRGAAATCPMPAPSPAREIPWPAAAPAPAAERATPESAARESATRPPTPPEQRALDLIEQQARARKPGEPPVIMPRVSTATAPQTEEAAMIARERRPYDRDYWRPARSPTAAEVRRAQEYLREWKRGGIYYEGPRTFAGRRQYRMVEHGGRRAVEIWEPVR